MSDDRIGSCPFCKFEYMITDDILGVVVTCPNSECAKEFTVGAAEAASSAPAETKSTAPAETKSTAPAETKSTASADTKASSSRKTRTSSAGLRKTPPADTTKKTPPAETKKQTPPAETAKKTPPTEAKTSSAGLTKTPPAETTGSKLRKVKEDDFKTVHPDDLTLEISRSPMLKTLGISLALHVALIALLSIGNFMMCLKYKTFSVTGAVADHTQALQDEKAAEKKAERTKTLAAQKAKRDAAQVKSDAERGPETADDAAEKPAREKSAIEKELTETSSERPTESSMSLDDMDDGL